MTLYNIPAAGYPKKISLTVTIHIKFLTAKLDLGRFLACG